MEVSSKVDKINEFCTSAGGSPNAMVNISEKEPGNGIRVLAWNPAMAVSNDAARHDDLL